MLEVIKCPIQVSFDRTSIGKKWTLTILRDLIFGMKRFMDFLKTNPGLSGKVLSARLREMEIDKLVKKEVYSTTPVLIEYHLTQKGAAMNKILYELSMFGAKYYPEEVFGESNVSNEAAIDIFGSAFKLQDDAIAFNKAPIIRPLKTIDLISD
ncbi:MAG: helix-turn-helix transcriptional regulator [Candidatus Heimdallarchaeota archaeon]|nr:helix-turn-helix transcriptional regulator [Candidatus Heimdallarchaeota archaeon]